MTWSRLLWMWTLSMSMTFLVVPSSRVRSWTWSSWMRTVLSTMPELALAIRSVKKVLPFGVAEPYAVERLELRAQVGDEIGLRGDR
jgi:uncharacterized lipoprotein YddW (UPF0748 family)